MAVPILDPYATLGVGPDAGPRELASAYRRLARRHHPDVNPDPAATQRMRRINEAWTMVSRRSRIWRASVQSAVTTGTISTASSTGGREISSFS